MTAIFDSLKSNGYNDVKWPPYYKTLTSYSLKEIFGFAAHFPVEMKNEANPNHFDVLLQGMKRQKRWFEAGFDSLAHSLTHCLHV